MLAVYSNSFGPSDTVLRQARLSIVIVNYRTPQLVIDCIDSVIDQLNPQADRIVVVDNASADDSLQRLRCAHAEFNWGDLVLVIASSHNGGFSAGNNQGIRAQSADFYLLANADTLFRPSAIDVLLDTAHKMPKAGLIGPRLEWPDGEPQISCFNFHSPISEFIQSAGTGVITRMLIRHDVPQPIRQSISECQWISFACVLVRAEVLPRVGLMDEGYFLYYEDVAFSRCVRDAGYTIVNNPNAHVVHLRGQSTGIKKMAQECARLPRYYYQSRSRYLRTFYGVHGWALANVLWSLGRCVSLCKEILLRRPRGVAALQWKDIWTW